MNYEGYLKGTRGFLDGRKSQIKEVADSTAGLSPTASSSGASPAARLASPATLQRFSAVPTESRIVGFHTLGYASGVEQVDLVDDVVTSFNDKMRAEEIARVSFTLFRQQGVQQSACVSSASHKRVASDTSMDKLAN